MISIGPLVLTLDPRKAMPRAVLVKFDHYTGPALFTDPEDGRPVVPILPVRREFEYQGVQCLDLTVDDLKKQLIRGIN